jgi:tetratricopeptide (TPR) repeat protein
LRYPRGILTASDPAVEAALVEVLCLVFDTATELRAFLLLHVDRKLVVDLPGDQVSLRKYAIETAEALQHRGALDAALFQALADTAPGRHDEIHRAATQCGQPAPRRAAQRSSRPDSEAWLGDVIPDTTPIRATRVRSTRRPEDWLDTGSLPPLRRDNPASLLHARRGVVPFHGWLRGGEVARLQTWWRRDDPVAVMIVAGPGGAGKTRLMLELCAATRTDGLVAGFVGSRTTYEDFVGLFAGDARTLAIVDYAETRPAIGRWLARVALSPADPRLRARIVLVVRALGEWWDAFTWGNSAELDALLRAEDPVVLDPDALDSPARARIYAEAAAHFAQLRGQPVPQGPVPDLASPRFGRVLYLHMAALASVEGRTTSLHGLLADTLRHERQYWSLELPGVDASSGHAVRRLHRDIDRAVMAVALAGGADTDARLDVLLTRAGVDPSSRDAVKERLIDLYPGTGDGTAHARISPLSPDLLAEAHLGEMLLDPSTPAGFVTSLFAEDPAEAIRAALLLLGRVLGDPREVAADDAERLDRCLRVTITDLLAADLAGRAPVAVEVAASFAQRELRCPFAEVVAELLCQAGTPALALALATAPISLAVGNRPISEWILRTAADTGEPATQFTALIQLAALELGREHRDVAHATMSRACAMAYAWAEHESEALWSTAFGVGLLGLAEVEIGEVESGLARVQDGLAAFTAVADAVPEDVREPLRLLLGTGHGLALLRCGEGPAAIAALQAVVDSYATLAVTRPGTARAERALADFGLGQALGSGGRPGEAAAVLRRAVAVQRELVAEHRGTRLAELAWSLGYLCDAERRLGAVAAALAAGHESVHLFAELAEADIEAAAPGLGQAYVVIALAHDLAGEFTNAHVAATHGVALLRSLAERLPRVHTGSLAVGLMALGLARVRCGERAASVAVLAEADALLRPLAARLPDVYVPMLARCLTYQGFAQGHDREAMVMPLRAALDIYRGLPDALATAMALEWGFAAVLLAGQCTERETLDEAIAALTPAITAMQGLPDTASPINQLVLGTALLLHALSRSQLEATPAVDGLTACLAPLRAAQNVYVVATASLATALDLLARVALARVEAAAAGVMLDEAVALWRYVSTVDPSHADDLVDDLIALAGLRRENGRVSEARELVAEAERTLRALPDEMRDQLRGTLIECLTARAALEPDPGSRLAVVQEALALAVADLEDAVDDIDGRLDRLLELLELPDHVETAIQTLERAVAWARPRLTPDNDDLRASIAQALDLLSDLHEDCGAPRAALSALRAAVDLWRPRAAVCREQFAEALDELAEALEAYGRLGEARIVRMERKSLSSARNNRRRRR